MVNLHQDFEPRIFGDLKIGEYFYKDDDKFEKIDLNSALIVGTDIVWVFKPHGIVYKTKSEF